MPHRDTDKFYDYWLKHAPTQDLQDELATVEELAGKTNTRCSWNNLRGEAIQIRRRLHAIETEQSRIHPPKARKDPLT